MASHFLILNLWKQPLRAVKPFSYLDKPLIVLFAVVIQDWPGFIVPCCVPTTTCYVGASGCALCLSAQFCCFVLTAVSPHGFAWQIFVDSRTSVIECHLLSFAHDSLGHLISRKCRCTLGVVCCAKFLNGTS